VRLEALLAIAPANTRLRLDLARLYRWRGWPDAAAAELALVAAAEPDSLALLLERGELALARGAPREGAGAVEAALTRAPREPAVAALEARWIDAHRPQWVMESDVTRASGSAFEADGWTLQNWLFSGALAPGLRAFVHDRVTFAELGAGAGDGRDHRLGGGLDWQTLRWGLRGEIHQGLLQNEDPGLATALRWQATDRLAAAVAFDLNTADLPLRATRADIAADRLSAGLTVRRDERLRLDLGAEVLDFDDGNRRGALSSRLEGRLRRGPRHQLFGHLALYTSRNDALAAPYFNPQRDFSSSAGVSHRWRIFRRYDRALSQRLTVDAGRYWQEDFGTGPIWTVELAQQWTMSRRWQLEYGVSRARRRYDGDAEDQLRVFLNLSGRL